MAKNKFVILLLMLFNSMLNFMYSVENYLNL